MANFFGDSEFLVTSYNFELVEDVVRLQAFFENFMEKRIRRQTATEHQLTSFVRLLTLNLDIFRLAEREIVELRITSNIRTHTNPQVEYLLEQTVSLRPLSETRRAPLSDNARLRQWFFRYMSSIFGYWATDEEEEDYERALYKALACILAELKGNGEGPLRQNAIFQSFLRSVGAFDDNETFLAEATTTKSTPRRRNSNERKEVAEERGVVEEEGFEHVEDTGTENLESTENEKHRTSAVMKSYVSRKIGNVAEPRFQGPVRRDVETTEVQPEDRKISVAYIPPRPFSKYRPKLNTPSWR